MLLNIPPEPNDIRAWMQSLKRTVYSDPSISWDASVVWAGNKLPKYLWDHWKGDLKPLGLTWQKFMWILRQRTDVSILWYQGKLPWVDFVQKTIETIRALVDKSAVPTQASSSILPPQDLGASQVAPFSDWEPFERFCRDLWTRLWENSELARHGRTGQAQAGVDIFGEIKRQPGNMGGIQCKKRDAYADSSFTTAELREIVEEAKTFNPALREFVVAYTGKSDVKLQEEARNLTESNRTTGLFSVRVCSWDDIKELVGQYPDLLEQYQLVTVGPSTKALEDIKSKGDAVLKSQVEQAADTKKIAQDMGNLRNDMSAIGELMKTATSGGDLAGEYTSEIDEIRSLIDSAHPKQAFDRLTALEKRLKPDAAPVIKFRVITNKAASLAAIGEEEKAALLFIEAFQYNPHEEKALCNKALGYVLLGQRDEAEKIIKEVLERNPLSERGHELSIYNAPESETLDSIIARTPEVLRSKEAVAYALAHAARDRSSMTDAIQWLETAVKNLPSGKSAPDLKATLATAILQAFEKRHDVQAGIQISSSDRAQLERALELLNEAIGALEQTETLKYRTNWVGNRAVAHKLLGEHEKALADAELAIKLDPDKPGFLRQKAFLLHEMGKSEEAIEIFRKILGNSEVPEVALLLGGLYHENGNNDEAISILEESIKNTDKPDDMLSEEKRLLIHAYLAKNDGTDDPSLERARALCSELRSDNPGSVLDLVVAARIERRVGKLEASNQLLNEARTYVSDASPLRDVLGLADDLYAAKRYADAYPLYERFIDPKGGSPLVGRLIYSYYEAEQYQKAYETARAVPDKDKTRFIYDVEVSILDSMGDVGGALAASEKILASNPDDLAFKVKWATYLLRAGQTNKLDKFLQGPIDPSKLAADVRFPAMRQLAWLYAERGMSMEALEVGYQLRKSFPRNGDAHVAYMSIFFDREKSLDDRFSPKTVDIDTAVAVEEPGSSKRWYIIEKDPGSDPNDLAPEDPLAKKLMGKKVNDEIVQEEGKPSESRLKIVELKSKYVYALHETMSIFPHLFNEGDNPALKRFTVKTDPEASEETGKQLMEVMESQIGSRDEYILKVQKLYEEGKLPLGTFASLIGRDPITVWGGLVNNPRVGIRCCAGTQAEREDAIKSVQENTSVAVDLTAPLTLASMEKLDLLASSFDEIFVAQSTVDTLTQEISSKGGLGSDGYMTVWKENGQYYRQEVSAEDIKKQVEFLTKIKTWITDHCTVAPVTEMLKLPKEQREQLHERMGDSFIDTIFIAKEKNCPIYTDDHGTRAIAFNDHAVKGFWTQTLAIAVGIDGGITSEELEKINTSLCERHYRHTTISSKTLLSAAGAAGWSNSGSLGKVLNGITGPGIEIGSAMGVAMEFFHLLWREPEVTDLQREALVFATLDAVAQGRDKVEVIRYAAAIAQVRFRLIPIVVGNHILKLVSAWRLIR